MSITTLPNTEGLDVKRQENFSFGFKGARVEQEITQIRENMGTRRTSKVLAQSLTSLYQNHLRSSPVIPLPYLLMNQSPQGWDLSTICSKKLQGLILYVVKVRTTVSLTLTLERRNLRLLEGRCLGQSHFQVTTGEPPPTPPPPLLTFYPVLSGREHPLPMPQDTCALRHLRFGFWQSS